MSVGAASAPSRSRPPAAPTPAQPRPSRRQARRAAIRRAIESVAVPGVAIVAALVLFGRVHGAHRAQPAGRLPGDVPRLVRHLVLVPEHAAARRAADADGAGDGAAAPPRAGRARRRGRDGAGRSGGRGGRPVHLHTPFSVKVGDAGGRARSSAAAGWRSPARCAPTAASTRPSARCCSTTSRSRCSTTWSRGRCAIRPA